MNDVDHDVLPEHYTPAFILIENNTYKPTTK